MACKFEQTIRARSRVIYPDRLAYGGMGLILNFGLMLPCCQTKFPSLIPYPD